jgi:hypothetical protein
LQSEKRDLFSSFCTKTIRKKKHFLSSVSSIVAHSYNFLPVKEEAAARLT